MKASISGTFALLLLASCSSKSSTPAASGNVTASGGVVTTSDGTSVEVPAGAVSQPTTLTIGGEPNAVTISDSDLVGPIYRIGPEGMTFTTPVTVTVRYDPSKLASGTTASDVVIMTAPVGSSTFTDLATAIVDDTHVSTTTTHFSDFVAAVHRKNGHADLSISLEPGDLATAGDLASSTADDLGGANANLTPNQCPHTFTTTSGTCQMTANATPCGGSFSLNCVQAVCFCQGVQSQQCPKPSPYTNTVGCPPQNVVETIWSTCCHFP